MKITTRRSVLAALALGTALALPGPASAQRQFTFAYDQPRTTVYGIAADIFDAKLKDLSGGKLSINQFPGAQLGQEPVMLQKMRSGDIDFVITSTANASTLAPQAGVFSLHFIFRDQKHLANTLADVLPDTEQRRLLRQEVDTQPMLQGREITLIRKDGSPVICLNTAAVVRDTSGKVVRYHGALMDITERREMERRLYQQQEFARRLIDSFPDLILVLDAAGHYTFTSPRVKDILGYDPEEYDTQELGERTHM